MQVSWATGTGHRERADHVNEDFVGAVPDAVVLLDGAGIPGAEHLCRHGVEWYTRRLGTALSVRLPGHGRELVDVLADAIGEVAGDAPDPMLVTDGREAAVRQECLAAESGMAPGTVEHDRALEEVEAAFRARQNTAGGFWVAKDEPAAAREAVLVTAPLQGVTGVGLLSNGVTRLVDPYAVAGWAEVVTVLACDGPTELVRLVRQAERQAARRDAGWDAPDDATVAWLRPGGHPVGPGR